MVAPSSKFYGKIGLVFLLTLENDFCQRFNFHANRKSKRFQYFNFETDFLLNGNLFQKAGVPFFSWKH